MHSLRYAKVAVQDYNKVGALTVSTKYVVRAVARQLSPRHRYIVDYGAGDGILAKSLLMRLPQDARLTAVESNDHFYDELLHIRDPRFQAIQGCAFDVARRPESLRLPRLDVAITSIPFTFVDNDLRDEMIANTYEALSPGGIFIVYQYTPLVTKALKRYFTQVKTDFEPRNIPPYFIMRAEK